MHVERTTPRKVLRPVAVVVVLVVVVAALAFVGWKVWSAPEGKAQREASLEAASQAYNDGKFAEAEQMASDVLVSNPGSIEAKKLLAMTLAAQGKNEEAIAVFSEVVGADPKDHESFYRMAVLERLIGRTADAITHFEKAVSLKKDRAYADELARTYVQVGRYEDAIEQWQTVVADGALDEAQKAQVYAAMASAYEGLRNYENARAMLKEALHLTPNDEQLKARLAALEGSR
ncbi:tetratricopeptide repeat protein [Coriobacteriia bacterium Es71-Z0120]|uniref:tetratricopeptide repeat protein n=1 Tax=Parvivirga hydrogeniphila TaxID=2939460 RepID=UPI0022609ADB|nr:tetratricopeptide repeat protein [Parvivirga hydrogeniphila]MCL4079189.1 tetratricopeptide repeat protein [Parvivirga hydrogeniphila]